MGYFIWKVKEIRDKGYEVDFLKGVRIVFGKVIGEVRTLLERYLG